MVQLPASFPLTFPVPAQSASGAMPVPDTLSQPPLETWAQLYGLGAQGLLPPPQAIPGGPFQPQTTCSLTSPQLLSVRAQPSPPETQSHSHFILLTLPHLHRGQGATSSLPTTSTDRPATLQNTSSHPCRAHTEHC